MEPAHGVVVPQESPLLQEPVRPTEALPACEYLWRFIAFHLSFVHTRDKQTSRSINRIIVFSGKSVSDLLQRR
jgi:hypothetical protein